MAFGHVAAYLSISLCLYFQMNIPQIANKIVAVDDPGTCFSDNAD